MIARTIGRRYAKALMAVTTDRRENPEELLAELEAAASALAGEPRFGELMANPKVLLSERLAALGRFLDGLQPRPLARHFFQMLLKKGRLGALPEIVDEYRTLADERAGLIRATVTSAAALAGEETERLRAILGARFGKTVVLTSAVSQSTTSRRWRPRNDRPHDRTPLRQSPHGRNHGPQRKARRPAR